MKALTGVRLIRTGREGRGNSTNDHPDPAPPVLRLTPPTFAFSDIPIFYIKHIRGILFMILHLLLLLLLLLILLVLLLLSPPSYFCSSLKCFRQNYMKIIVVILLICFITS